MLYDQHRLGRRLRGLERAGRPADRAERTLRAIAGEIERSIETRGRRARSLPRPRYPEDLPIVQHRWRIIEAIDKNRVVVICGETGSGKTTQLPKFCLELGRGAAGMVGHTQPRRIAARTVAARIASELAVPLGKGVGYKIRFGDRTSDDTLVKVMTDGILLAETQGDRSLARYDTIIIDEAHERSLNIDFLLGYIKRLLPRRPELKVIITSATIDPQRFSEHFDDAPIIEVSGRTHPVEVRYRPLVSEDPDEADKDVQEGILHAVDELASVVPGDVLIFLPGEREIREAAEALRKHHPPETEILPLYARLSAAEQNRVFQAHARRRIVLATNVAETSLTVPGIMGVVDTGLARISRYNHRTRVQGLQIESISRASAAQRAGRCGRIAPGVCVRLYAEDDHAQRDEFTLPEIRRANLASVILQMKSLRLGPIEEFPFVEPPDRRMIREGYKTLWELGAIQSAEPEGEGAGLTGLGRRMARLPIDPRLSRMLLAADAEGCLREVLIIASALSVRDPRERPFDRRDAADQAHAQYHVPGSDFLAYVKLWDFYHEQARHLSRNKLRKCCRDNFLSSMRLREWHDIHTQLKALVTSMGFHPNEEPAEAQPIHRALLTGLLSNVALRKDRFGYEGAGGTRLRIFPGSALFKAPPRWIMSAELVHTTQLYARTVGEIEPGWIEGLAPHLVRRSWSEPRWDRGGGKVVADERVTLYGLEVVAGRVVDFSRIDPIVSRELFIRHGLVRGELRSRARFLGHNRRLIERVGELEARLRRPLLADESVMEAFFDRVLPEGIASGSRFNRWYKRAAKREPEILCLSLSDLIGQDPARIESACPDHVDIQGMGGVGRLRVSYVFDHDDPADGVTMHVPIEALARLPADRGDWLVPGLLREKVAWLVRSLPKALRKLVDADRFAAEFVANREPTGSFVGSLGDHFQSVTGTRPPDDAWVEPPEWLRMHYRVEDGSGSVIASGRDLAALRRQLADQIARRLADIGSASFNKDGLTDWDIGDLPEVVEMDQGGVTVTGYPAMVDRGRSVSLRLMVSRPVAERATRAGLRRLFVLKAKADLGSVVDAMPGFGRMAVHYATLGSADQLKRELTDLVADRVYLAPWPAPPRTRDEFQHRLDAGWDRLGEAIDRVAALAGSVLAARHDLLLLLDRDHPAAWLESIQDIRDQLDGLVGPRCLTETPWAWLTHYPRYLRAMRARLGKLPGGGLDRDRGHMADLAPHLHAYAARINRNRDQIDPELERVGWMIQELRVSLFAQELGTAMPVSFKRLREQWTKIQS